MTITLYILVWLACGAAAVGFLFAQMRREFKHIGLYDFHSDREFCFSLLFLGLCAVWVAVAMLCSHGYYGWLWPWSAKAKREAGL